MPTIHGFELIREQAIPELNTQAQIYRHSTTGALLLSLQNDDENKCFGITFRTLPNDSTGVAHILEHGVLAGSRKYPLKDPFAELLKGSLKTFLNAMTYPDKTVYPVASTNLADFYNLVDVYLDTVFHPLLRQQTFAQQGWHYELGALDAPLTYKGVVFNEMKGVYSSPDSLLYRATQQSLFPDTLYGVDSGGNPTAIPDLTYEQWVAFHRRFYHPSNALAYFYGDDDPTERLRLLDGYFSNFEAITLDAPIPTQPRFATPRHVTWPYAVSGAGNGTAKHMANIAWVIDGGDDQETVLALDILEHILIGTSAAPLRKALIDSGLGDGMTGSGLMTSLRELAFWVGLKGVAAENVPALEQLVLTTLQNLVRDGIDPAQIDASLNSVEFALRENNTGSMPRGLSLYFRVLSTWLYGGDPLEPIAFEAPLAAVKAHAAAGGRYFERLIERYLLNNPHRLIAELAPDADLQARNEATERARLAAARATMDEPQLQAVIEATAELKRWQETPDPPEALATIPSLKLSDLEPKASTIPLALEQREGVTVLHHDLFTNGICYVDVGMDLHTLPQTLLPYVPLFGRALTQLGTARENFVQLSQRIGRSTGGVWAGASNAATRDGGRGVARLFLRGKATSENTGELLAIMRDVLLTTRFDNRERFRQLVLESRASLESALVPSGHAYVGTRLSSRFNQADWVGEQQGGVSYLFFLRQLAQQVDSDWPAVQAALEQIRTLLVTRQGLIGNMTIDAANWAQIAPQVDTFLAELPATQPPQVDWQPQALAEVEGLSIPAQVNYVGKGTDLYRLGFQRNGALSVISHYLRVSWLWERVRVQGGAYGGFCSFDQRSGVFSYTSYRDPNLLATLDVYDQTGSYLRQVALSPTDLTRAIIGTVNSLDAYQLPDAKGWTSLWRYLLGETDELRQQYRDEVLHASVADFRAFADAADAVRDQGNVVVIGGAAALDAARASFPTMRITNVL